MAHQNNHRQALRCFDRIIKIEHDDVVAWWYKGIILQKLEQYGKSQKCFEQTTRLCKKPVSLHNTKLWSIRKLENMVRVHPNQ